MSQPRWKVSVNVNLDGILCIAEPFVTKPSMVIHHYKPEDHVRKMGFYLQGQGHSNWICVHTMKSWLFLVYVLNCWFFGDQLSLTVHVHKLECLVKRLFCCSQGCIEGSEFQWMFYRTISLIHHHRPEYHSEIILLMLQSKLVWWYIITRHGKTLWKDFLAFTQGVRRRTWVTVD